MIASRSFSVLPKCGRIGVPQLVQHGVSQPEVPSNCALGLKAPKLPVCREYAPRIEHVILSKHSCLLSFKSAYCHFTRSVGTEHAKIEHEIESS